MQRIQESELILNERGAIYHLNLLPNELAGTVITVGDPDRVEQVSKHFDHVEYRRRHREFVTHTGRVGNKRISVVSTGIGPDNIDIVFNEIDALVNIDLQSRTVNSEHETLRIIRIGTSGSLQEDIPVDELVASTFAIGIDNLLNFYRREENEEEKQILQAFLTQTQLHYTVSLPYVSSAGASLLKHFVGDFHHGVTVTCPGFYAPQGRILRGALRQPELIDRLTGFSFGQHRITNFEMETSAIYGLGKLLGHSCLSLSAIVANRVKKNFSIDSSKTVERLIVKTLEILENSSI